MKTILFPTDFSNNARGALNFAIEIANIFQSEIILFNSYPIPVYAADLPIDMSVSQSIRTESESNLKKLAEELTTLHPNLKFTTASNWGFASDEIITAAKDLCADIIIMGTKGASGIKKILMGSNTSSVIAKAHCPILAIPEGINFTNFKNIAFATDCLDEELLAVEYLCSWIKKFNSNLTLIHVADGILNHSFESTIVLRFKEKIEENLLLKNVEYDSIDSPDFVKGITEFLLDGLFDLVVMAHHRHNFIEQLFNPSHAEKLSYKLALPLLMIPIENK